MNQSNQSTKGEVEEYEVDNGTFKFLMHLNGTLSLFASILGIGLIIFKSTPHMKVYRFYLLNLTIWSGTFDIFLGFFYAPQLVFPAFGVCSEGLLRNFKSVNLQIFLSQLTMWLSGGLAVSICAALLYRLGAITQSVHLLHTKKSICGLVLLHLFYMTPAQAIDMYTLLYDYNAVLEDLKTRFAAIYRYNLSHNCVFFSLKVTPIAGLLFPASVMGQIFIFVFVNMMLVYIILKKLNKDRQTMSPKTFSMHKQFTLSLAIQFALSNLFILPFLIIVNMIIINKLDTPLARFFGLIFFVFGSLHSTLNIVCMICFTKPYRDAMIDAFYCVIGRQRTRAMSIVPQENSGELNQRKQSVFVTPSNRTMIPQE